MPMKRYGLRFPDGARPADIELVCFNRAHPPEAGGLGAYAHLRNAIDIIWNEPRRQYALQRKQAYDPAVHDAFIWNEWTELMMRGFCEEREVIVAGPGACVAGDTRLLDPITGLETPIRDLCRNGIQPIVMTLDGPELAEVPFVKGVEELFEIVLSDGSRFRATAAHRVLTSSGYVTVGSLSIGAHLLGFEQIHSGGVYVEVPERLCVPLLSPSLKIQERVVVSITRTGREIYYDIGVPKAHHYFAEGAIHHNSWKTTTMAIYYLCYWLCSPFNTRVILTSTTGDGLRARIWKELIHFYRAVESVGNLVQSRTMIQTVKGDDGAGIYGIAVESDGNIEKAIGKIIGRHNTNMGIGIDEMPTVNSAIVDAGANLETGAERFKLIGIGNPNSRFDEHGKASEPTDGWSSISDLTETWRTRRGGLAIHLDGRRSPRIRHPDKFPGMICQEDINRTADRDGENSPKMWQQRIGFWAPEGITNTVLSETMILRHQASEPAIWEAGYKKAAGLDPSFEGDDRKVLRIVKFGKTINGKQTIAMHKTHIIKVATGAAAIDEPLNYQTIRQVKAICEEEGVPPELFGLDSTGAGGPLADMFAREWSPKIHRILFGGKASAHPVSSNNPRKGFEEYGNRVTELWYRFAVLVRNDQIRQLDEETAKEFCSRYYELRGAITFVESKRIMKARSGQSPDLADGLVVACAVILENDTDFSSDGGNVEEREEEWKELAKLFDMRNELLIET